MLPAAHRLRDGDQYRAVLRHPDAGRAGGPLVVVHVLDTDASGLSFEERTGPRVGFVVSKAVGNAVVRARTKRVLRHLMRQRLGEIPASLDVVVRANPAIAGEATDRIDAELTKMLTKAQRRMSARTANVSRETSRP